MFFVFFVVVFWLLFFPFRKVGLLLPLLLILSAHVREGYSSRPVASLFVCHTLILEITDDFDLGMNLLRMTI